MQDYYSQIYGSPDFDPYFQSVYGPRDQLIAMQQPKMPSSSDKALSQAGNLGGKLGGRYLGQQVGQVIMGPTANTTVATPQILGAQRLGEAAASSQAGAATSLPFYANPAIAGPATVAALGAAAYNYGGRQVLNGNANAGNYLDLTLQSNPVTAAINPVLDVFGLGTVGEAGEKIWGSGKGEDQVARDRWRSVLQEKGLVDDNWMTTNPDGSQFNIGAESQLMLPDGTQGNQAYNLDTNNPLAAQAAGAINPFAAMLTNGKYLGGAPEGGTPAMMLANSVLAGADSEEEINANLKKLYEQFGINQKDAFLANQSLRQEGLIDEATQQAYNNAVNQAFGQEFYGDLSDPSQVVAQSGQAAPSALPSIYPAGFNPSSLYNQSIGVPVSPGFAGLESLDPQMLAAIEEAYGNGAQLKPLGG